MGVENISAGMEHYAKRKEKQGEKFMATEEPAELNTESPKLEATRRLSAETLVQARTVSEADARKLSQVLRGLEPDYTHTHSNALDGLGSLSEHVASTMTGDEALKSKEYAVGLGELAGEHGSESGQSGAEKQEAVVRTLTLTYEVGGKSIEIRLSVASPLLGEQIGNRKMEDSKSIPRVALEQVGGVRIAELVQSVRRIREIQRQNDMPVNMGEIIQPLQRQDLSRGMQALAELEKKVRKETGLSLELTNFLTNELAVPPPAKS